ncbi:MAG: large subunit ribosomal protein L13 [Candidatus Peregrinibacteria bacterium Greene0416_62]|nr:MAG: large subunit ribosomal protein L13 [Candidatus Peregrinibacteria bacterium Greene0416_62]TSD00227.1 MAG: large subunit ribosomal protein L13 [Candidatus Peregrinibacteria bacterium Greene1014_49]
MKTSTPKPAAPAWLLIDAEGQMLGRIAVQAAHLLRGKHKPEFSPHQLFADHVVIVNAGKIAIADKKARNKIYYSHSPFPGSMKKVSMETLLKEKPTRPMEKAIKGMLPKNRLRDEMMKRLHVFAEAEHTFGAQKPVPVSITK